MFIIACDRVILTFDWVSGVRSLTPSVSVITYIQDTGNMEPISNLVKVSVPNYLAGLPIPNSIGGWFHLGVKDWLCLIPPTAALAGLGYMSYRAFCPHGRPPPCTMINPKIKKDNPKVVDSVDIEDITEKAAFCRCWRSENWPYCDGSHGKHNKETGDNVGPLVVKR